MASHWLHGADGEIQPGLFLAVHGRSLHALGNGILFAYVRWFLWLVVGLSKTRFYFSRVELVFPRVVFLFNASLYAFASGELEVMVSNSNAMRWSICPIC